MAAAAEAVSVVEDVCTVTTFCRICEAACGLVVTTDRARSKVLEIRPDSEHVVSEGYACVKGIRFGDVQHSPDRLRMPMRRTGPGPRDWEEIGWEQALSEIGAKLRRLRAEHGPDSIAVYQGNPLAFNSLAVFGIYGFCRGLGSRNLYTAGSQDCSNKFVVSDLMYGAPYVQPIPDFDNTDCFVVLGSNPAISQMSFVHAPRAIQRLRSVVHRGGRVVFVNPRRTESAHAVGEHLFIRPGTDVFFLLSFLRELLTTPAAAEASADPGFSGFGELAELVAPWTPERTAPATGVEPEALVELVSAFAGAGAASMYCSTGVNQGGHGSLSFWLTNVINAVSGNLDRRGGMLFAEPPLDLASIAERLGIGRSDARSRIGDFGAVLDAMPGAVLADEILTPGPGQVRALIVAAGNPLLSFPNGDRLAEALERLELVVAVDMFRNETAEHAHYLLPALSWLERPDLTSLQTLGGFQPVPYVQYTDAVVRPAGDPRDEWWIFRELAHAAGVDFFGRRSIAAAFGLNRKLAQLPLLGRYLDLDTKAMLSLLGLALRKPLSRLARREPHGALLARHRPGRYLGRRVRTEDGLVHLAPRQLTSMLSDLDRVLESEVAGRSALKLITKRERHGHNSWTHNAEVFVGGERNTNHLWMHPGDAAARGLNDGDLARVVSAAGSVEVPVRTSDDLMPAVVALPHGWGHQRASGLSIARRTQGRNANLLAADGPGAVERLSGMARLTGIEVEVEPADPAGTESEKGREEAAVDA